MDQENMLLLHPELVHCDSLGLVWCGITGISMKLLTFTLTLLDINYGTLVLQALLAII